MNSGVFWDIFSRSTTIAMGSVDHGPRHWERVMQNGRKLALATEGADILVIELFALFHDSMRESEFSDHQHGKRGFELAERIGVLEDLTLKQQSEFYEACVYHDGGFVNHTPTIGVCWDADRLDLPRVGITPNPALFSTEKGKELADAYHPLV